MDTPAVSSESSSSMAKRSSPWTRVAGGFGIFLVGYLAVAYLIAPQVWKSYSRLRPSFSASYDKGVGLSHTTGQVTHHIGANVDAERDHLAHDLVNSKDLSDNYLIDDFHTKFAGRNGGGDPWHTDGDLWVGVVAPSVGTKP